MMNLARPLETKTNETGQFMSALAGFLRRMGYLPGTENGYQPANDSAVTFYRLGGDDTRLVLRRDMEPWTVMAQTRNDAGIWEQAMEPQPVREFIVEMQTVANNDRMNGEADDIWAVFGTALNDALRKSYGWVARLDLSRDDTMHQTMMIGSQTTGIQCRLIITIAGDDKGKATLEMLSHGEPSEWLTLDKTRITTLLRSKDTAMAVAQFLRLA